MKLAIANDHTGVDLKQVVIAHLEARGYEVVDLGASSYESSDYPIYGRAVGEAVARGEVDAGVAICGTGVGISIAANKVKGVRCACVSEPLSAQLAKRHNNANVVAFGARVVGDEMAKMIVDCWLDAEFEGGRHARRVGEIGEIEADYR